MSVLRHCGSEKNELTESIPAELGRLPELRHLALNDNQLSGSIPTEMGKLGGLEILDLENNALTGQIPSELGKLSKLRLLLLSGNSIVGPLPRELGQLGNLSRIRVDPDVVVGCIPAGLVRFFDGPICPEYANPCENGLAVKNPEEHPGSGKGLQGRSWRCGMPWVVTTAWTGTGDKTHRVLARNHCQ